MAGGEDDSALGLGNSTTGDSGLSNETLEHVQQMAREELQERLQRQEEELLQLQVLPQMAAHDHSHHEGARDAREGDTAPNDGESRALDSANEGNGDALGDVDDNAWGDADSDSMENVLI